MGTDGRAAQPDDGAAADRGTTSGSAPHRPTWTRSSTGTTAPPSECTRMPGLGPRTLIYSILTTAMHRWRSSSRRPSSGTASNAAMPSRSTRARSGSRARTRCARAAAIWGRAHPHGHVHRQHRAAPRHGWRTAGQGSGRDCAGGIHHSQQWRLDHVRQIPKLTACATGSPDRGDHSEPVQLW
jgi:hypothetical protein